MRSTRWEAPTPLETPIASADLMSAMGGDAGDTRGIPVYVHDDEPTREIETTEGEKRR